MWSRVTCQISMSFPGCTLLFSARCVYFMFPKVNCAIYSAQFVCVFLCARIWSRVNCPISVSFARWTVLFTVRSLHVCLPKWFVPSTMTVHVSVCVRVCECIWSRVDCPISVSFPGWTVLFTARRVYFFLPPKENCATYSAQLVCVCLILR